MKSSCDSPVTIETANHHKLSITTETGPGRARTALVTTAQHPEQAELAVRAHRMAASPAVSGRLQEKTGGEEEKREMRGKRRGQVEEKKRDERKEERTGGGEEER
ncbi:hypothetical protein PAMP_023999 [Pampus punctatissimus]